jgi:outer membrane protein OmpA-like peptidoglycan-associated protein
MDYARNPLVIRDSEGNNLSSPVSSQLYQHVGASVILWNRLRLGASLPVAVLDSGSAGTVGDVRYQVTEGAALGDARLGADVRLLGRYGDPLRLAAGLQVMVPTGQRGSYTGDGKARFLPRVLGAGDIGQFTYGAQLMFDGRMLDQFVSGRPLGPAMDFAAAAGVRVANGRLVLGPELHGGTSLKPDNFFTGPATAVELLAGGHYEIDRFWHVGLAGGKDFTTAVGSPSFRVLAMVAFAMPFEAPVEAPPAIITTITAAPPPVVDTDQDGVADRDDACPTAAGDRSTDPALNGCPDRDRDGIADKSDACAAEAGVASTDPTKNGCPVPPDRDRDGIADRDDACPGEIGVASPDVAKNGCPIPPDGDQDGIADRDDACPTVYGDPDPIPAKNGCPKVRVVAGEIQILERIEFENNQATLRPESTPIVQAVARVLGDHPEIKKVRVEGYTDSKGKAASNLVLSQARVDAVVLWLTGRGVDGTRLVAKGFGKEHPVASNGTAGGRQRNRRVQFIILEQDNGGGASASTP